MKSCHLIRDRQGKSRRYAFVRFHHRRDATRTYDKTKEGLDIEGRQVLVDRQVDLEGWVPRRLGKDKPSLDS